MSNSIIAKVIEIGAVKDYKVNFRDGSTAIRPRVQVKAAVDVYDDILEETLEEEWFFSLWDTQAVKAAEELEEGKYLYVKEFTSKLLDATDEYPEPIIARNIKQFKTLAAEKAAQVKAKLGAVTEDVARKVTATRKAPVVG